MKISRILALLLFCCSAALGVEWHEPKAQARAVFARAAGPEASVLVSIPYEGEAEAQARAFRADGREIPVSVVHQSRSKLHVLVRTGAQRTYAHGSFYVYYGHGLRERPEALVNKDYEPVTVAYYSNRGRSIPTDWKRMQHLMAQQGAPVRVKTQDSVEQVAALADNSSWQQRSRHRTTGAMVRISSHIVIPEAGLYRFHLNCNDAGFVMLNREIQVAWPGRHSRGTGRQGNVIYLEAGPHLLEVYGAASSVTRASVALSSAENEKQLKSVEDYLLVSSSTPKSLRIEEKERTLHAGFSYTVGRPYKFRNTEPVFVPVALQDFSDSDLSWQYNISWRTAAEAAIGSRQKQEGSGPVFQAGREDLAGKSVTHVFDSMGLHRIAVEVRDALGFEAVLEREIDTRNLHFKEYAVSAVPVNTAPCLFSDDIVDPSIRVSSKGAESLEFLLEWKWRNSRGAQKTGSRKLSGLAAARTIKLFSARAGDITEAEWELSHRGYRVDGGRMLFNRFPYAAFPEKAVEDRLYDSEGNQLFYVASRAAPGFRQPAIRSAHLKAGVVCFDDLLSAPRPLSGDHAAYDKMLAGMLSIDEQEVTLQDLASAGGYDRLGAADLLKGVAEGSAGRSGIGVLSIGMDHFLSYDRPMEFERMLACAVDMLASRKSLRTVLVTLPPTGEDREAVREYAASVRRVAGARGIPVADLFSAFMGMGQNIDPFMGSGPELSDAGLRLSCQVIARAVIRGYRVKGDN